jgi:hypothetical protein
VEGPQAPPGWYDFEGESRWWDGNQWGMTASEYQAAQAQAQTTPEPAAPATGSATRRGYEGTFGFQKTPAELTALFAQLLAKNKTPYYLQSQSDELAVFSSQTPATVNVLVFGVLGKTRANTITISYSRADGYTHVSVFADAPAMGKQFEQLRSQSVI